MTTDAPLVRHHVSGAIATLTLDSPHNRNALSAALVTQLAGHLAAAAADDAVRAVVLTHTGGTFCAGADLAQARTGGMATGAGELLGLLRAIVALPKPVVGRIAGHVRAGGMGLVGACDIVIAGPAATFAFTEARLGLAPAVISLTTLPRMAPRAAARYYVTGEVFGPQDAVRCGLVTEAADDLDAAVDTVTSALRLASPQGLRESKALTSAALLERLDAGGPAMAGLSARLFGSPEAAEGMAAFLARRSPAWVSPVPE